MTFKISQYFYKTLSALLGIIFLYSAYTKLFPIEPFEFEIVRTTFVSWEFSLWVSRLVIVLEILLGLLLLFSYKPKLTNRLCIIILAIFSIHLIFTIYRFGNIGSCACFGEAIPLTPLQGIIKNAFLISISIILLIHNREWYIKSYVLTLAFIASLATVFITNPIDYEYAKTYLNKEFENFPLNLDTIYQSENFEKIGQPKEDIRDRKVILAFLSSSCKHCTIAAKKMGVIHLRNPQVPFYFFINGNDQEIDDFKILTGTVDIASSKLNGPIFIELAGVQLPIIYYFNKGMVEKQVNYYTISQNHIEQWLQQ